MEAQAHSSLRSTLVWSYAYFKWHRDMVHGDALRISAPWLHLCMFAIPKKYSKYSTTNIIDLSISTHPSTSLHHKPPGWRRRPPRPDWQQRDLVESWRFVPATVWLVAEGGNSLQNQKGLQGLRVDYIQQIKRGSLHTILERIEFHRIQVFHSVPPLHVDHMGPGKCWSFFLLQKERSESYILERS